MFQRLFVVVMLVVAGAACSSSSSSGADEPRFIYVLNEGDPSVSWYRVDADTGNPRHLGYVWLEHAESVRDLVLHPSGRALYVSDPEGAKVHRLDVDRDSGALAYAGMTEFSVRPVGMAVSPNGRVLYLSMASEIGISFVGSYPIHGGDYSFPDFPEEAVGIPGYQVSRLAITPDGRKLFLLDGDENISEDNDILRFDVSGTALGEATILPTAMTIQNDVVIDAAGEFLFVAGGVMTAVAVYRILPDALEVVATSPSASPYNWITVSTDGRFVYAGMTGSVSALAFDAEAGELTWGALGSHLDPSRFRVTQAMTDPANRYVYTLTSGSGDGESLGVAAITPEQLPEDYEMRFGSMARAQPRRMVFATGRPLETRVHNLYVADASDDSEGIDRFRVRADGSLASRVRVPVDGSETRGLAVHPHENVLFGTWLELPNAYLGAWGLDGSGYMQLPVLEEASIAGQILGNVSVEPSGRFVYPVTTISSAPRYFVYSWHPHTGELEQEQNLIIGGDDRVFLAIETDPAGHFNYIAVRYPTNDDRIRWRGIDVADGRSTGGSNLILNGVTDLAISADGSRLAAVTSVVAGSELVIYRISPEDGGLTLAGSRSLAHAGQHVAFHPGGEYVYTLGTGPDPASPGQTGAALEVFPLNDNGVPGTRVHLYSESLTDLDYTGLAVAPDARALYVGRHLGGDNGALLVFALDDGGHIPAESALEPSVSRPGAMSFRVHYR